MSILVDTYDMLIQTQISDELLGERETAPYQLTASLLFLTTASENTASNVRLKNTSP